MKQLAILIGAAACASSALAIAPAFHLIVRSGDPKPQGGNFLHFTAPIFDGETLGVKDDDAYEVYKSVALAPPTLVAKGGDLAPGFGGGTYTWLDWYSPRSALRPARQGIPYHGQAPLINIGIIQSIWSDIDQPNNLAAEFMIAPDGGSIHLDINSDFASDDRNVLFTGNTSATFLYGAYCVLGGNVKFICNSTTVVPSLGVTMNQINATGDIRGEYAVTRVSVPRDPEPDWYGILRYRLSNGGIDYPVAFEDLVVPIGETFLEIGPHPVLSEEGKIAFYAGGYSAAHNRVTHAILRWEDDFLTTIVDNYTPRPGVLNGLFDVGPGTTFSASADRVAFTFADNPFFGYLGLYVWKGGSITRAAGPGTVVGSKTIFDIRASRSMLAGYHLAFTALFTDGSQGVVVANVCSGDLNDDGIVEDGDFVLFASAYNLLLCEDPVMPVNCPSDLNSDSLVDDSDFVLFAAAYDALLCS